MGPRFLHTTHLHVENLVPTEPQKHSYQIQPKPPSASGVFRRGAFGHFNQCTQWMPFMEYANVVMHFVMFTLIQTDLTISSVLNN